MPAARPRRGIRGASAGPARAGRAGGRVACAPPRGRPLPHSCEEHTARCPAPLKRADPKPSILTAATAERGRRQMDRMSPQDAMFLHVEDANDPMHIGGVSVFDGPPPAYGDLVRSIAAKLPLVPRYRQKVRFVPLGLGRPVWVD